jgi:hypothetical protein
LWCKIIFLIFIIESPLVTTGKGEILEMKVSKTYVREEEILGNPKDLTDQYGL